MTYRDDREALHHRVGQLEQELEDARREGKQEGRDEVQAHTAGLEQKLGGMRIELERMEAELQAMRGQAVPQKKVPAAPLLIGGLAFALVMGGTVFYLMGAKEPPPVVVAVPRPEPLPSPKVAEPETPRAAPETIPVVPIDPPAPSPARSTTARWTATVTRADGLPLAPGASCAIEATIATTDTNAIVRALSVQCGPHKLYRSADALNGMAQMSNDAREMLGPTDDKSAFTIAYRDIGSRTGERTQIDLDTKLRQGSVFRETLPRFRVDLSVPTASAPAAPLAEAEQRLRRPGKVVEISGAPPVKSGAHCVLRAMPTGKGRGCVAEVACGTIVLWPPTAPVTCTYEGSRPTGVSSDEGPASLALDESAVTLTTKAFGAKIAFDER